MIWLSFARWSCAAGAMFILRRIYFAGRWTPFVRVYSRSAERRRYHLERVRWQYHARRTRELIDAGRPIPEDPPPWPDDRRQ